MNGETLMRSVAAAIAESNMQPLLEALHDDVVWKSASNNPVFSFHGEHRGRYQVLAVFSNISRDYTFHAITPKEITSSGDVVWGLFDAVLCYDAKGKGIEPKTVRLDLAIRWRLKDGKIIENQTFFDTAHLLLQQRQLQP